MIFNYQNFVRQGLLFLKRKPREENKYQDVSKIVKKGFSIIELLIVLAIGAGIIAIALGYRTWINKSKEQTTEQKMASVDTMLEMYRTKLGGYPNELHELIDGPNNPALRKKWGEAYASESDLKDSWGNEFVYEAANKGTKYELYSVGSKGESKLYSPASQES